MSTLKSVNVIHPSSATNNIVNDASGNVTAGANLYVTGNVGVGTTSPSTRLQVNGTSAQAPAALVSSAQIGTTVRSNSVFRIQSEAAGRDVYMQFSDNVTNSTEIGMVGGSQYFATAGAERMRIDANGNLLVGTTSSTAKLTVNGYVTFTGQSYAYYAQLAGTATTGYVASGEGNWSIWCSDRVSATEFNARSDARLKKDVTNIPISDAISFVKNVPAVYYKWKNSNEDGHKFGFLAQDVVKAGFPNLVGQYPNEELKLETDADGFISPAGIMLTVNYDQIIPLLSTAIKELSAKNDALEARLAALEAK